MCSSAFTNGLYYSSEIKECPGSGGSAYRPVLSISFDYPMNNAKWRGSYSINESVASLVEWYTYNKDRQLHPDMEKDLATILQAVVEGYNTFCASGRFKPVKMIDGMEVGEQSQPVQSGAQQDHEQIFSSSRVVKLMTLVTRFQLLQEGETLRFDQHADLKTEVCELAVSRMAKLAKKFKF